MFVVCIYRQIVQRTYKNNRLIYLYVYCKLFLCMYETSVVRVYSKYAVPINTY